jgi:hypothetical protein
MTMSSLLTYISVLLAGKFNGRVPPLPTEDTDSGAFFSFLACLCLGIAAGQQLLCPLVSRQLPDLWIHKRGKMRFLRCT